MTKMLADNIGWSIEHQIAKLKALRSIIRRIGFTNECHRVPVNLTSSGDPREPNSNPKHINAQS